MKLAENREDWAWVVRNMEKILGGVSVNAGPRSREIWGNMSLTWFESRRDNGGRRGAPIKIGGR